MRRCRLSLLFLVVLGCDWFQPRVPNDPTDKGSWEYPDEPYKVLSNLESALEVDFNAENYDSCLVPDSFRFEPDPYLINDPNYQNWGFATEDSTVRAILSTLDFSQSFPVSLTMTVTDSVAGPVTYTYVVDYTLELYLTDGSRLYGRGVSTFELVKSGPTWACWLWKDQITDTTSWAELKAQFR